MPVSFSAQTLFPAGSGPGPVCAADANGDGKSDLVVANSDGTVSVILGNGDGTFMSQQIYSTGSNPDSVFVADLNGDGKADIVVANSGSNTVSILLGNGDGTFKKQISYSTGAHPYSVSVADFNGDGKIDLVVSNYGDISSGATTYGSLLIGNGDGTFQPQAPYASQTYATDVSVADFNRDGKADLVVANYQSNSISVLVGNGDGKFQTPIIVATGSPSYSVAAADFNGDGKADLVVANYGTNSVSILLGNGDGTFQTQKTYATGSLPYSVSIVDFNGDGKGDLLVYNNGSPGSISGSVSLLLGNGDGTFQSQVTYSAGISSFSDVSTADFNGDNKADFAVTNYSSNNVSVLLNTTSNNHAPTINGAVTAQAITDLSIATPFSGVTISDLDVGQTEMVNITLSNAANGGLTNLGSGTYSAQTGIYTVSGSTSVVTAAIDALVFTPTANQVAPGSAVTTSFSISVNDGAAPVVINNISSVIATSVNDAPTIRGAQPGISITDKQTTQPFASVVISDPYIGQADKLTLTVILSNASHGVLSNLGAGTFDPLEGIYSVSGTLASVNAAIKGLIFTPSSSVLSDNFNTTNLMRYDATKDNVAGLSKTIDGTVFVDVGSTTNSNTEIYAIGTLSNGNTGVNAPQFLHVATVDGGPESDVIFDKNGNLFFHGYDNTSSVQSLKEIEKTATGFSASSKTLLNLPQNSQVAGETIDSFGNLLYGVTTWPTSAGSNTTGSIYELQYSAGGYAKQPVQIANFNNSVFGPILDKDGDLLIGVLGDNEIRLFESKKISDGSYGTPLDLGVSIAASSMPLVDAVVDSSGNIFVQIQVAGLTNTIYQLQKTALGYASIAVSTFSVSGGTYGIGIDPLGNIIELNDHIIPSGGVSEHFIEIGKTSTGYSSSPVDLFNTSAYVRGWQIDSHGNIIYVTGGYDSQGKFVPQGDVVEISPTASSGMTVTNFSISVSDGFATTTDSSASVVATASNSSGIHGIDYFWKSNAIGQHALLSGVIDSVTFGAQPIEGANAPIQFKNIAWDATGHATVDVYAHVTTSVDSVQIHLGFGATTNASFVSALTSDWTLLGNRSGGEYVIGGYSVTALATGDVKLGTVSFDTGSAVQLHLAVDAGSSLGSSTVTGSLGTITATPYGMTLSHSTTGADGAHAMSPLDPGAYALTATRSTSDIGTAITSADALAALKIAVGMDPNPGAGSSQLAVSPFQIIAADVNGDGRVTSADALAILKMAVHMTTALTPQWVFVDEARDLSVLSRTNASWDHGIGVQVAGDATVNLVGVLSGDVNGSWTPPSSSQYVETLHPTYFTDLSATIHAPLSEWGVL